MKGFAPSLMMLLLCQRHTGSASFLDRHLQPRGVTGGAETLSGPVPFQPMPAPGPGSCSIPSTHTELCDHCTSAVLFQHRAFRGSKSPAKTNLHHRKIDVHAQARKTQLLKKKKKANLFLLTETPLLPGQSFNILQSPAKPEFTVYAPSALTYLLHCCQAAFKAPRSPLPQPCFQHLHPGVETKLLIPATSLAMEALPGTWGSSSSITLFFPEEFGKCHTFPMQSRKDWAGTLYIVIHLNREGLDLTDDVSENKSWCNRSYQRFI